MTERQDPYRGDEAFRRAVSDRLRTQATHRNRPVNQLRREFVFQRFLARVFADTDAQWILKGGAAMLARLPDARHSRDVDLYHPDQGAEFVDALAALTGALDRHRIDRLRFAVEKTRMIDDHSADLHVATYIGAAVLDRFTVDLTVHLRPVVGVENVVPEHVLDLPGLPDLPTLRLYPVHDQIADKVCAMYARYGDTGSASSRYRDLVDILLILRQVPLDAHGLGQALRAEAHHRGVALPQAFAFPGPDWAAGYRKVATTSPLPRDLHDPAKAIALLAEFLRPARTPPGHASTWDPATLRWEPGFDPA